MGHTDTSLPRLAANHQNGWGKKKKKSFQTDKTFQALFSFGFKQMTTVHRNPCGWASGAVWGHIHPLTAGSMIQRATPPAAATAARAQLAAPHSRELGQTIIPTLDALLLLHAKVLGQYTLANFFIAFCCSAPGTKSPLGQGCRPYKSHSKPLTNPVLISPVHTVCFYLLLPKSVILQGCLLLSREAK